MTYTNCVADTTPVNYFDQVQEYDLGVDAICAESDEKGGFKPLCGHNNRLIDECECRTERIGRVNCGQDKDNNYCLFYGVGEPQCIKYTSCKRSLPNNPVKIETSTYATVIEKGSEKDNFYYCDCSGRNERMDDCSYKYCYDKGGEWACREAPPVS